MENDDFLKDKNLVESCVFHYTSVDALTGMIEVVEKDGHKEPFFTFWASHIACMNDPQENKYALDKMMTILGDIETELEIPDSRKISRLSRKELDDFITLRSFDIDSLTNKYSVSFTDNYDTLPMWSLYGQNGNGICLGFDEEGLSNYVRENLRCDFNKVAYGIGESENPQEANRENLAFKGYVKHVYERSYNAINDGLPNMENRDVNIALNTYICLYRYVPSFCKHPAYKYENEQRIECIEINHDVYFRSKGNSIVPYVKLRIPARLLKLICLGPTMSFDRHILSIGKLLKSKGIHVETIEVTTSSIPYVG